MAKKQATLAEEITNCQNSDKKYKKTGGKYREMIGMFNISAISLYLYLSFLPNYQFLTAKPSFFLLGYLQSIGYVPKL